MREKSNNKESLNLGTEFETSNEHAFLIGHSSSFDRSINLTDVIYIDFMKIYFEIFFVKVAPLKIVKHQMIT